MKELILDNRRALPLGSLIATKDGNNHLLLYTIGNGVPRELAVTGWNRKRSSYYYTVPDITKPDYCTKEMSTVMFDSGPDFFNEMQGNKVVNLEGFQGNPVYEREETVALLGGGPVEGKDIELLEKRKIPIVAVNNAIKWRQPKYWVGIDSRAPLLACVEGIDVSAVEAFLYSGVFPAVGGLDWKSIGWFSVVGGEDGVDTPIQFGTEGVVNQALQFIYRELRPKKIVMLGVQNTHPQYFWIGLALQAICFWYSRAGACIWNCTEGSTIMGGVFVGPLGKALEFRARKGR